MNEAPEHTAKSGISIAALIVGILAFLTGIIPVVGLVLGVTAITLGIIGIKRKQGKGKAVTGLVMGSIATLTSIIIVPLLIFLAIPALQQNQKDIGYENDVTILAGAVSSYQANNQGKIPSFDEVSSSQFKADYTNGMSATISSHETSEPGALRYNPGFDCDGVASETSYSVSSILLNDETYCVDNR